MTNSTNNNSVDVQVLQFILTNLVTLPEDVKITREIDELGVLVTVIVNANDMGLVIGKDGGMAKALKKVMKSIGKAHKMNIRVQFLEPDGSNKYGTNGRLVDGSGQFDINDADDDSDGSEFALN
jgi:uncharacterized protein